MASRRFAQWLFVLASIGALGALVMLSPLAAIAGAQAGAVIDDAVVAYAEASQVEVVSFDDDTTLVASYRVEGGVMRDAADAAPLHRQAWSEVTRVIPADELALIRQFTLFDEGAANTVAMVHQSGVETGAWILSIDIADAGDTDLLRETLLHELAHIVTLGRDAFTFDVHRSSAACSGIEVELGCAHEGSFIESWSRQFWADPTAEAQYDIHDFVAPYAATSAHEDLAETFLYWAQGNTDAEAGSVLEAKFAWFDSQPELVEVRDRIAAAPSSGDTSAT